MDLQAKTTTREARDIVGQAPKHAGRTRARRRGTDQKCDPMVADRSSDQALGMCQLAAFALERIERHELIQGIAIAFDDRPGPRGRAPAIARSPAGPNRYRCAG